MKKTFFSIASAVLIVIVIMFVFTIAVLLFNVATAEDELTEAWVLCSDYVHVRVSPNRKSEAVGYVDAGDSILVGSKKKNGFVRCYGIGEYGEGWIHTGYLVYEKPVKVSCKAYSVSRGKLRARRHIKGKRVGWIKHFETVQIYWWTDEWCVTDKGFVESRYLELDIT